MSKKRPRRHLDLEVLQDEYEKGWSVAELARRERVNYANLRNALCKIYGTERIRHFKGRSCYNAVASELNIGETSKHHLRSSNLKKTRAIFLILSTRRTYADIGEEVQLSRERIGQIADEMNLVGFDVPTRFPSSGQRPTRGFRYAAERTNDHDVPF